MEKKNDESTMVISAVQMVGKLRHRRKKKKHKLSAFERRYTALGPKLTPEQKRIDYVLVHKRENEEKKEDMRERFEAALSREGFSIKEECIKGTMYKLLHCPFKRLCKEAELIKLEMPLKGKEALPSMRTNRLTEFLERHFDTDKDEVDFISAPFRMNKIEQFEDFENPTKFFRPALRSYLCHHIMRNIDIRDKQKDKEKVDKEIEKEKDHKTHLMDFEENIQVVEDCIADFCACCPCYGRNTDNPENIILSKMGLPYLLMKEVYTDAYILHEDSKLSKVNEVKNEDIPERKDDMKDDLVEDPRKKLDETWCSFWKWQPTWKIRNYYGEKIAFYFAWIGLLMTSLWFPMFFGMACFGYGLSLSLERQANQPALNESLPAQDLIKLRVGQLYDAISGSFDNNVTPFFALVICLWGTIFLEFWKRHNARLAYEWDVDQFEMNEPDRPEFFGTKLKKDPVTQEANWFYPFKRQLIKFTISASALLFMIMLVFVSLAAVVVYRVIISVDYCSGMSAISCLLTSSLLSAVLNAISIIILGKVYDWVAMQLTLWENHRTQTQFDDALIIKLFAFSFANSYSSCFYIAFVRGRIDGGVFGLGPEYNDACEGESASCMSQLSFQVLVLMLAKPIPRFLIDIVLPFVKRLWRKWRCCRNQVKDNVEITRTQAFLYKERFKPAIADFTLTEYTEKVIIYGFLCLFAAAFPLAPLVALLVLFIDKYIDAKRLLWLNRRPVAFIAQDIGMWYSILNFVNLVSVISNGFLIAFGSSWGLSYSPYTRLWIVIGFEHIVFALKFFLAYLIPDVPKDVRLAIRREKYQVAKLFEDKGRPMDYRELIPSVQPDKVRPDSANYGDFPPQFDDHDETPAKPNKKGFVVMKANAVNSTNFGESKRDVDKQGKTDLLPVLEEEPDVTSPTQNVKTSKYWYELDAMQDTSSPSPRMADSHGSVSLRGVDPEGSRLLNKSGSEDKLTLIDNQKDIKEETVDLEKSVNFLGDCPPPPPPADYQQDGDDDHEESDISTSSSESEIDADIESSVDIHHRGNKAHSETKC
ncbi:anoctamin-4-like isoform X2 [Mya arenaria]|uniref:anoctamin-4-like isoform X2 n=1 Tax=Mya arenaria TaxID=6604 RepID=UPI0022E47418|nr:anoctamin-4-like isoform X2 [Mya arenaria]